MLSISVRPVDSPVSISSFIATLRDLLIFFCFVFIAFCRDKELFPLYLLLLCCHRQLHHFICHLCTSQQFSVIVKLNNVFFFFCREYFWYLSLVWLLFIFFKFFFYLWCLIKTCQIRIKKQRWFHWGYTKHFRVHARCCKAMWRSGVKWRPLLLYRWVGWEKQLGLVKWML